MQETILKNGRQYPSHPVLALVYRLYREKKSKLEEERGALGHCRCISCGGGGCGREQYCIRQSAHFYYYFISS
jgi:hypothetical protein